MIRKSVNLSGEDEETLAPFLTDGTDERDELANMVGEESIVSSDSAALVALARIGADVVRARMLERGYAELAATWDDEDTAWLASSPKQAGAPRPRK